MDWHNDAIQAAYSSDDEEWILTAVFSMCYVKGFEDQVLESLNHKNPDIFYEAVCAAGNWGIKEAWPYINKLLTDKDTDKWLLIAAIEGAANICQDEAIDLLMEFSDSEDEDIADAAEEALAMAGLGLDDDFDPEEDGLF
jgi:HEAT repeat protein